MVSGRTAVWASERGGGVEQESVVFLGILITIIVFLSTAVLQQQPFVGRVHNEVAE